MEPSTADSGVDSAKAHVGAVAVPGVPSVGPPSHPHRLHAFSTSRYTSGEEIAVGGGNGTPVIVANAVAVREEPDAGRWASVVPAGSGRDDDADAVSELSDNRTYLERQYQCYRGQPGWLQVLEVVALLATIIGVPLGLWAETRDSSQTIVVPASMPTSQPQSPEPIAIGCGSEYPEYVLGSTRGAPLLEEPSCGDASGEIRSPGRWYSLLGDGSLVTLSTCNGKTEEGFDTRIRVYRAAEPAEAAEESASGECVAGSDDANEEGGSGACAHGAHLSTVSFEAVGGVAYSVLVDGLRAEGGYYRLDVRCRSPSADIPRPGVGLVPDPPPSSPPVGPPASAGPTSDNTQDPASSPAPMPTTFPTASPTSRPTPAPIPVPTPAQTPKPTPKPTPRPAPPPTNPPVPSVESTIHDLVGDKMYQAGSPHATAADWIIASDPMRLGPGDANLPQRYALAALFFGWNGMDWTECAPPGGGGADNGDPPEDADASCDATCYPLDGWNKKRGTDCRRMRWLSGSHECDWLGVTCWDDESVRGLVLFSNNLSGSLLGEIALLDSLQYLILRENDIAGSIPSTLGTLNLLEYLYFNDNSLTGTIPDQLYNLSNLKKFMGYDNQLSGTLSSEGVKKLGSLEEFKFGSNSLSGTIPATFASLPKLADLWLGYNDFTGTTSDAFCDAPSLEVFYADCAATQPGNGPPFVDCPCCTHCCDHNSLCYAK